MLFEGEYLPAHDSSRNLRTRAPQPARSTFFDEQKKHSEIKTRIVVKYFGGWTRVLSNLTDRLAYIDPYAGPGYYDDGSPSTPILILKAIIADEALSKRVVTIFSDKDAVHAEALRRAISSLPGIANLSYAPQIDHSEVDNKLTKQLKSFQKIPTLFFVDPFGYAGLTLDLIYAVLRDWACECIFFFNYDSINRALVNDIVRERMDAIFGGQRVAALRSELAVISEQDLREEVILSALADALAEVGGTFMHTFRFLRPTGRRHHLVFVSKNFRGYHIMKEVMASESSVSYQGVPTYEFIPDGMQTAMQLYSRPRPLDALRTMLLEQYRGKVMRVRDIYYEHSLRRPYLERNYKTVLRALLDEAVIEYHRDEFRPKLRGNTMPDDTWIHFPS